MMLVVFCIKKHVEFKITTLRILRRLRNFICVKTATLQTRFEDVLEGATSEKTLRRLRRLRRFFCDKNGSECMFCFLFEFPGESNTTTLFTNRRKRDFCSFDPSFILWFFISFHFPCKLIKFTITSWSLDRWELCQSRPTSTLDIRDHIAPVSQGTVCMYILYCMYSSMAQTSPPRNFVMVYASDSASNPPPFPPDEMAAANVSPLNTQCHVAKVVWSSTAITI